MATANLYFSTELAGGKLLRSGLTSFENGFETLNDVLANMAHMIDGDGSSAAHFTEVMGRYGFDTTTTAKAAYDELASLLAKLNTDASVTSVNAAILQLLSKMR